LGFHPAAGESKSPKMLLIAGLSGTDAKEAEVVASGGVDAGLVLNESFKVEGVNQVIDALGDIPLGVFLRDVGAERVAELVSSGCDFVVFDTKVSVAMLSQTEIGKFLVVEPSLDQGLVRAIDSLDIDGVLINRGKESFITVEHVLTCQRFRGLVDKPLVAILPSLATDVELNNLWRAGVDAVVVPPSQPTEALAELRRTIDNLPRRTERRQGKLGVVIPQYAGGMAAEEEEEEEEEDI